MLKNDGRVFAAPALPAVDLKLYGSLSVHQFVKGLIYITRWLAI
jgi:hypothetical protein